MALPKELALDAGQIDELMGSQWNMRIASLGPGARINLTPMWFGWAGGRVYFYGPRPEGGQLASPTRMFRDRGSQ